MVLYHTLKAIKDLPYSITSAVLAPIQDTIKKINQQIKEIRNDLGMDNLRDKEQ